MHRALSDTILNAADDGLRQAGRDVLKAARARVPVDDKVLWRSGKVVVGEAGEVEVIFDAPHAWLQHEKTEYEHPNGGEAKYLETAALETDVAKPVADHIRAVLRAD
jgi:hypothetical protein